jgi:hypothetical protein
MDTIQLQKILEHYAKVKNFYYGVFAADRLPTIDRFPSCLIMNNQKSTQEGQHWVAIFFNKKKHCEFFDSFGKSPAYYGIQKYLKEYSTKTKYNTKIIQSNVSPYCGLYCIFFLIFKLRGRSMDYYVKLFKKNPLKNDIMFSKWIDKYLEIG